MREGGEGGGGERAGKGGGGERAGMVRLRKNVRVGKWACLIFPRHVTGNW